ncbi:restriction endonuclease subunit S [Aliivibrio fischeri]|uniref:Type I restriction endonuclease EcoAI subunit S n=1 Tax=Aliivibrio fischeri TaxID=668 RepID=A0A510UHS3_ALIFS|nr:restriction endonuclease subunit S [Aliivibrio fischeri]GEK12930.1 type I restriction endonuclease EcoAI subunit S [Aliivibrio fischeri]
MSVERLITDNIDVWTSTVKTKSASGRGSSKKIELYGIKKLRELILELAVRGKLVPQDPTDEPASVLLERIAEEKAQLIKDKKIKKNRKQPTITQEEIYFPVPANWGYARLEDIYDVRDGTHDSPKPTLEGYPLVTSKNLSSGKLDLSDVKLISKEDHLKVQERSCVDRDDILFAMIGSIGNPVIVDIDVEFSIKNVGLFKYYNRLLSCPNYLNYFLKYAAEIMKKQSAGGVQPFVSLGKLRGFVMLLPPLAEQNRIVTKVDELMSLCDQLEQQTETSIEAHQTLVEVLLNTLTSRADAQELMQNWQRISEHFDALFTTEKSIDTLKQTILQLAVMGKLVPQDPNDEPAVKLLERIAEEKAQLIKDKKIKKQKALPEISEDEKPFDLPSGWEWSRFGDLGYDLGGGTPSKGNSEYWGGPIPWVSPKDMKRDYIDSAIDNVTDKAILETTIKLIPENSLLMVVRGMILAHSFPVALTKKSVVINQDMKALIFNNIEPEFLLVVMKGIKNEMVDLVDRSSHGTCKLVSDKLWNVVLAIPSLRQQRQIVEKTSELLNICDQLKARLKESQTTQLHLTDAIIDKAL